MRFMDGPYEGCRQVVETCFNEGTTIHVPTGEDYLVVWNGHDMRWEAWTVKDDADTEGVAG